jgi:hypothetical protein
MASWYVSEEGKSGKYVSCTCPPLGSWVSYYDHLIFEGKLASVIRAYHKTAEGKAERAKIGYDIRVVGKYEDVLIVIKMLEDNFDAVDLNSVFSFPPLPNWVERLRYLIRWIATGQK